MFDLGLLNEEEKEGENIFDDGSKVTEKAEQRLRHTQHKQSNPIYGLQELDHIDPSYWVSNPYVNSSDSDHIVYTMGLPHLNPKLKRYLTESIRTKIQGSSYFDGMYSIPSELIDKHLAHHLFNIPKRSHEEPGICVVQPIDKTEMFGGIPPKPYPIWSYNHDRSRVRIPFMVGLALFGPPPASKLLNDTYVSHKEEITFNGKLYESNPPQKEAVQRILNYMDKNVEANQASFAQLVAPPGSGKTCMMIAIMAHVLNTVGGRIGILVHTKGLREQWMNRLSHFLGKRKDGGSRSFGFVQGDVYDVQGREVVIMMIPSVLQRSTTYGLEEKGMAADWKDSEIVFDDQIKPALTKSGKKRKRQPVRGAWKKNYPQKGNASFSLICVDESHHVGSKEYCKVFQYLQCSRWIMASGTPEREGIVSPSLQWLGGPMVSIIGSGWNTVDVYRRIYKGDETELKYRDGILNTAKMVSRLVSDWERSYIIWNLIVSTILEGRHILVLSLRKRHIRFLAIRIQKWAEENGYVPKDGKALVGLYTPEQLAKRNADDITHAQVIFASYSMASEYLDVPTLDTLFLATPCSKLRQIVGRILRAGGKRAGTPAVYDVVDPFSIFEGQWYKRNKHYREKRYCVRTLDDEVLINKGGYKKGDGSMFDMFDVDIDVDTGIDMDEEKDDKKEDVPFGKVCECDVCYKSMELEKEGKSILMSCGHYQHRKCRDRTEKNVSIEIDGKKVVKSKTVFVCGICGQKNKLEPSELTANKEVLDEDDLKKGKRSNQFEDFGTKKSVVKKDIKTSTMKSSKVTTEREENSNQNSTKDEHEKVFEIILPSGGHVDEKISLKDL